jgi:hypothetical protein
MQRTEHRTLKELKIYFDRLDRCNTMAASEISPILTGERGTAEVYIL